MQSEIETMVFRLFACVAKERQWCTKDKGKFVKEAQRAKDFKIAAREGLSLSLSCFRYMSMRFLIFHICVLLACIGKAHPLMQFRPFDPSTIAFLHYPLPPFPCIPPLSVFLSYFLFVSLFLCHSPSPLCLSMYIRVFPCVSLCSSPLQ